MEFEIMAGRYSKKEKRNHYSERSRNEDYERPWKQRITGTASSGGDHGFRFVRLVTQSAYSPNSDCPDQYCDAENENTANGRVASLY